MGIFGAFLIALAVGLLFAPYKGRNSMAPLVIFFAVLFLAGIAAQYWIVPFGPIILGVSWFPIIFVVIIFALLFSATPGHRQSDPAMAAAAIGIFVWLLLVILAVAILIGLFNPDSFKP